jgi:hypothetical protein
MVDSDTVSISTLLDHTYDLSMVFRSGKAIMRIDLIITTVTKLTLFLCGVSVAVIIIKAIGS